MNVQLDETQEMLRTSARQFLSETCPLKSVREMRASPAGYSATLWYEMAQLGWQGLALPEHCAGSGMPFLDLCLLIEELGRACVPSPFIGSIAGCSYVLARSNAEAFVPLLKRLSAGDCIVTPALSGATDASGTKILPEAHLERDGYAIAGCCHFVPHAASAQHLLCTTHLDQEGSIALLLVPINAAGVTLTPLRTTGDERPCHVDFANVHLSTEALVSAGNAARALLEEALQRMDIARCCDIAGALSWVLDDTVTYAKDRKQFGQPIGGFQVLQHYCADMYIMLEGLRVAAYHAAWKLSQGLPAGRDVAIACAHAHRVTAPFLSLAHQIHGAMGVTKEHDLHLYTTHAVPPGRALLPAMEYLAAVLSI